MKYELKTNKNLDSFFRELGLSENEAKVFIFLLQFSAGKKVADIARGTHLNRTTIYGVLKTLNEKNLLTEHEKRGVSFFQSIDPNRIGNYIESQKNRLDRQAKKLEEILPSINELKNKGVRRHPSVKSFDGIEGIKEVYRDMIKNNQEKNVYGFTGGTAIEQSVGEEWLHGLFKERKMAGVKWNAVSVDNKFSRRVHLRDNEDLREMHFLPNIYNFDIELATYDEKVFIISFAQDYPWALVIDDKEVARAVKSIFNFTKINLASSEQKQ